MESVVSEIMIAVAIMCHKSGDFVGTLNLQRECVYEILKCIDGKSLAHNWIAECIKPKDPK